MSKIKPPKDSPKKPQDKMNPIQFVIWMQGFLDAIDSDTLTKGQVKKIKDNLNGIFEHEAQPPSGGSLGKSKQSGYTLYRC